MFHKNLFFKYYLKTYFVPVDSFSPYSTQLLPPYGIVFVYPFSCLLVLFSWTLLLFFLPYLPPISNKELGMYGCPGKTC